MSDECTCAKCNTKRNRTAAFGAIRHAAMEARKRDRWSRNCDEAGDTAGRIAWSLAAGQIRLTIRAVIGSDKA